MKPADTAGRWAEVMAAFDEIVELDASARDARLAEIGTRDAELRHALEDLLAADVEAERRLARLDVALGSGGSPAREARREADVLGLVGRTVSHFRVIEPLAQGGMGIVYRAEDARLGRPVALKFALVADSFDRSTRERFLQEAQLAGALDHPNVCSIYEAGETEDGHLFHAMPLYSGETLKARIARDGVLPITDALAIAKQIAHGLSAAHGAGIIHRDLKPANVMLLPDGTVKILDFGLARAKDMGLTASRTALGTLPYMAPEQLEGRAVDRRADLWALGVVLYEMLTGRRPFDGEVVGAITHAILIAEPDPPSSVRGGVPAEIDDVVRVLLRKDPAERYQLAEEVATALAVTQVGRSGPREVAPRSAGAPAWRNQLRSRASVAAVFVAAALGIGVWFTYRNRPPAAPRVVAVLPFEDSTSGDAGRHLAVGVGDAISTELLRVRGVIVPSVEPATAPGKAAAPREVATALEAAAVVTGTVRRAGDRVLLDIKLFEPSSSEPVWEEQYDRPLADIPTVQRDATREILAALDVDLTDAERARLERPLTTNGRAYELYLRGREAELPGRMRNVGAVISTARVREAVSFYSQARAADPGFAVAHARLALMLMLAAITYDTTEARREQARLEAEMALRLYPGLAEAHTALASYWAFGRNDPEKAIAELKQAVEGAPHDAELHLRLAEVYVSAGRWDDAVAAHEEAMRVDPRSAVAAMLAAFTYTRLRRDEEGMRAYDRAIALAPDNLMIRVIKGHTYLRWRGTVDTLAAALRSAPAGWDPSGMATWARYTVLRVQRRYADALAMLDSSGITLSSDNFVYQPAALMRAQSHEGLGDSATARVQYEAARAMLIDSLTSRPDDPRIHAALGLAHAALGDREPALREARRAMELVPLSQTNHAATAFMGIAVETFARAGAHNEAFELLELLLAIPAGREATVAFVRVWPGFDPLRTDPRLNELLARFAVS